MKTLKQILFLLLGLGIFSSCSSVKSVNSKLLVGNWKNVKISPIRSTQDVKGAPVISEKLESSEATVTDNVGIQESEFAEKLTSVQSVLPDVKSALEFRKDKTATYTFKDKSLNGSWTIDKLGKTVTFTGNDGSGTFVFEIVRISSQAFQAVERYPQGDVTINYSKK